MAVNTLDITKELKRKLGRDKSKRNNTIINSDVIALSNCNFKLPPLPDIASTNRLKDKVTSLVQMQIKSKQMNQNFLNLEKTNILFNGMGMDDKKEKTQIYINTKYEIVSEVALSKNYKLVRENDDWNVLWIDGAINAARAFSIKRHQKINHFPGMNEISRKDKLQKNLKTMQRYFPLDYEIFPKTWNLPNERMDVINYLRERRDGENDTFIIKPACSSQGRGIILISDVKSLSVIGNTICQLYISNPFLIDGYKFDLRIYVLVTSCDPFRIYVYEEGLARFATCPYEKPNPKNINNVYMHLTNYSVQRNSDKYNTNEFSGTKRRASTIYEWFKNNGYDSDSIWKSIDDVIIKTMLCANNSILHHYTATFPDQYRTSACFELLGFDIILDDKLVPFVLEVNHSPSLETETPLDQEVKSSMLNDVFNLVNSSPGNMKKITDLERLRSAERLTWSRNRYMSSRKAAYEFRKVLSEIQLEMEKSEMDNRNGFRLLYPVVGQTEKYQRFFDFNCEHHRNYFNRCVLLDEPEHRRFMEIQKDNLPKVMNKSGKSSENRYMSRSSRAPYGDTSRSISRPFKLSRDGTIINNTSFSNGFSRRNESIHGSRLTNSNVPNVNSNLLNCSKASLQKLISAKSERVHSTSENKANGAQLHTKNTDCEETKNASKIRKNVKAKKQTSTQQHQPVQPQTITPQNTPIKATNPNTEHHRVHKVTENQLNEQSSINLEWESSLCSNQIQHMSQLIISDTDAIVTPKIDTKFYEQFNELINSGDTNICEKESNKPTSFESSVKTTKSCEDANEDDDEEGDVDYEGIDEDEEMESVNSDIDGSPEDDDDDEDNELIDNRIYEPKDDMPIATNFEEKCIEELEFSPNPVSSRNSVDMQTKKSYINDSSNKLEVITDTSNKIHEMDPISKLRKYSLSEQLMSNEELLLEEEKLEGELFHNDIRSNFELYIPQNFKSTETFENLNDQELDFSGNLQKDEMFYSNQTNSDQFTVTESTAFQYQYIGELEDEIELMKCGSLEIIESFYDDEYTMDKVISYKETSELNKVEVFDINICDPLAPVHNQGDLESLSYSDISNNLPYPVGENQSNSQYQFESSFISTSDSSSNMISTYDLKKITHVVRYANSCDGVMAGIIDESDSLDDISMYSDIRIIHTKKFVKFKSTNFFRI